MIRNTWRRVYGLVFLVLLGSYAFFWHSRDWNSASRLMLTYALVDRGTVRLDGLDRQTGDIAYLHGHYYCDKLPGFSFAAAFPYGLIGRVLGFPHHPLGVKALNYWPADYWVTLATSGLATALTALLLIRIARDLGCSPRRGAVVGLAYGLATPAYVYATLAYGHQLSALALLAAFALIRKPGRSRASARIVAAGFLAACAPVIELQVGPVSAILGLDLLFQCLAGRRKPDAIALFAVGAVVPTLILLGYNLLAFGSPWDMGYFHHATAIFAEVHNRRNPLGLRPPDVSLIGPLLWGRYRGILFYAPVLALAPWGWWILLRRARFEDALVTMLIAAAVFIVNLSYPEWTGGWSTGPRLLVPLLPFAMVPVAAVLAEPGRVAVWAAAVLALAGAALMLLFQGVGARIPHFVADPLFDVVLPLWRGADLPAWWVGERTVYGDEPRRFARNLVGLLCEQRLAAWPRGWLAIQFLPLVLIQSLGLAAILATGPKCDTVAPLPPQSDLRVDQQQKGRRADEDPQDPEEQPQGVHPDPRP